MADRDRHRHRAPGQDAVRPRLEGHRVGIDGEAGGDRQAGGHVRVGASGRRHPVAPLHEVVASSRHGRHRRTVGAGRHGLGGGARERAVGPGLVGQGVDGGGPPVSVGNPAGVVGEGGRGTGNGIPEERRGAAEQGPTSRAGFGVGVEHPGADRTTSPGTHIGEGRVEDAIRRPRSDVEDRAGWRRVEHGPAAHIDQLDQPVRAATHRDAIRADDVRACRGSTCKGGMAAPVQGGVGGRANGQQQHGQRQRSVSPQHGFPLYLCLRTAYRRRRRAVQRG